MAQSKNQQLRDQNERLQLELRSIQDDLRDKKGETNRLREWLEAAREEVNEQRERAVRAETEQRHGSQDSSAEVENLREEVSSLWEAVQGLQAKQAGKKSRNARMV